MSKQYNIRWGRSDYSKLSHLVKKVNKKVFEIEVKRPDIADYQPDMLDYHELKSQIKTRQDFKNVVHRYERYLREGVEEVKTSGRGAKATAWAVKEFEIAQRAENVRRANTRKKLGEQEVTIAGKGTGVKRAEMGSTKENATKPSKKKFENQSQREWDAVSKLFEKKMQSTYNDEMQHKMISNYVKGLIAEGYSDELQQLMNKIPVDKFLEVIDTDEVATFTFIYDPLELKAKNDRLIELWQEYADDEVDNKIDFEAIAEEVKEEYENGTRVKGQGRIRVKRKRRRR